MKIKTINVYEYKELSDEAKAKARQWYLEGFDFGFEWDCIKDDAKTIGLDLTEWEYCRDIKGGFIDTALSCADKILKEHGKKCETYKTARKYLASLKLKNDEKRENAEHEFLRDILEDYRIMTDKQYAFVQSEEAIAETMECNEYEFDVNGKRI